VLARHAADLRLVFERLTGRRVTALGWRLRVGLLDHEPELGLPVHPACQEGVHVCGALLEGLGHHVEPGWPAALDHLWTTAFSAFRVVSDATRPPMVRWVSERLGRPLQPGDLDEATLAAAARATARSPDELRAAQATIDAAIAPIGAWWENRDVLVTPATFQPAWPLGGSPGPNELGTLAAPFSLSGQPALSLPLHRADDGRPVGVQLVARRGEDELLLALAEELQEAHDWTTHRPSLTSPENRRC
jgi:amidase